MKLSEGQKGLAYRIHSIDLPMATHRRLEVIGMTEGTRVLILERKKSGSMVVKFRGTRFALGENISKGISVGGGGSCQKL